MERGTMSGEWGSATEDSGAQSPRTTSMSELLASCADSWSYHHMVSYVAATPIRIRLHVQNYKRVVTTE